MYRIVYVSHSVIHTSKLHEELQNIAKVASRNNIDKNISGQLFFAHHWFVQVLEGELPDLNQLLAVIRNDTRHSGMQVIYSHSIKSRYINDWSQMEVITDIERVPELSRYLEELASFPINTILTDESSRDIVRVLEDYHRLKV